MPNRRKSYKLEGCAELSEIGICYFAALIEGLRLINAKAAERKLDVSRLDYSPLIHYVRVKGDQIATAVLRERNGECPTSNTERPISNHATIIPFPRAA
jgi:hypothetical protein